MRYLLIHTADPDVAPAVGRKRELGLVFVLAWETVRSGATCRGARLRPTADATTIKIRDGELIITDGPYAETREQVAGYDVLECASLDDAVRWAGEHPHSWLGSIEVRALPDSAPALALPEPGDGKTRYMMLVCTDPAVDPAGVRPIEPFDRWVGEIDSRGARLFGSELEPPGSCPHGTGQGSAPS